MLPISVVIITKNEAGNIIDSIRHAKTLSSDIIVVDAGSTDKTNSLALQEGARLLQVTWENFGTSRNIGAAAAVYDWILALDADERISSKMKTSILESGFEKQKAVFGFHRQNYYLKKKIQFGAWGHDKVYRFYNKNECSWDTSPVHEKLNALGLQKKILKGKLLHFPVKNIGVFREKISNYASLTALKYKQAGIHSSWYHKLLSPIFIFFKSYIFLLGFLDGREGFAIAKEIAWYTWLKYTFLEEHWENNK